MIWAVCALAASSLAMNASVIWVAQELEVFGLSAFELGVYLSGSHLLSWVILPLLAWKGERLPLAKIILAGGVAFAAGYVAIRLSIAVESQSGYIVSRFLTAIGHALTSAALIWALICRHVARDKIIAVLAILVIASEGLKVILTMLQSIIAVRVSAPDLLYDVLTPGYALIVLICLFGLCRSSVQLKTSEADQSAGKATGRTRYGKTFFLLCCALVFNLGLVESFDVALPARATAPDMLYLAQGEFSKIRWSLISLGLSYGAISMIAIAAFAYFGRKINIVRLALVAVVTSMLGLVLMIAVPKLSYLALPGSWLFTFGGAPVTILAVAIAVQLVPRKRIILACVVPWILTNIVSIQARSFGKYLTTDVERNMGVSSPDPAWTLIILLVFGIIAACLYIKLAPLMNRSRPCKTPSQT